MRRRSSSLEQFASVSSLTGSERPAVLAEHAPAAAPELNGRQKLPAQSVSAVQEAPRGAPGVLVASQSPLAGLHLRVPQSASSVQMGTQAVPTTFPAGSLKSVQAESWRR